MTNATWKKNPASDDYNTGSNWSGGVVPDGKATFGASSIKALTFSAANTDINAWSFGAHAAGYNFDLGPSNELIFEGAGISVAKGAGLTITDDGILEFDHSSTAGKAHIQGQGELDFRGSSNAGSAHIQLESGFTFADTSNAGSASLVLAGSAFGTFIGSASAASANIQIGDTAELTFNNASTAAKAQIDVKGTGQLSFEDSSTAGKAHIVSDSVVNFDTDSSAGAAQITVNNEVNFTFASTASNAHFAVQAGGELHFDDGSSGDNATIVVGKAGLALFSGASKAGNAHLTIKSDGQVDFNGTGSTADHAVIVSHGVVEFENHASAGNAKITNDGKTVINDDTTLGNATVINNGEVDFIAAGNGGSGTVVTEKGATAFFRQNADGDDVRLVTNAGGSVDFSFLSEVGGSVSTGSIEGAGKYFLGSSILSEGGNDRSTKVSGLISDGGMGGGTGAALVKQGTGTLTLSHAGNAYTGGTTLAAGTLNVAAHGAAGSGDITFDTGNQTLKIQNAALAKHDFANTIDQMGVGDTIDLAGLAFSKNAHVQVNTFAGSGTLLVTSGKVTDTVHVNNIESVDFLVKNDGHGGTEIVMQNTAEKPDSHVSQELSIDTPSGHHTADLFHDFI